MQLVTVIHYTHWHLCQFVKLQALMVNHDRFGLFRPTANEDGEVIHPEWSTLRNVHLDVSASLVLVSVWALALVYDSILQYQYVLKNPCIKWHISVK